MNAFMINCLLCSSDHHIRKERKKGFRTGPISCIKHIILPIRAAKLYPFILCKKLTVKLSRQDISNVLAGVFTMYK